jgi:hypothetical protein
MPCFEGFSTIGGGIVAVYEPGSGFGRVGDIRPLREVGTEGSTLGSAGSDPRGNAARNGRGPCVSDMVWGPKIEVTGGGE